MLVMCCIAGNLIWDFTAAGNLFKTTRSERKLSSPEPDTEPVRKTMSQVHLLHLRHVEHPQSCIVQTHHLYQLKLQSTDDFAIMAHANPSVLSRLLLLRKHS